MFTPKSSRIREIDIQKRLEKELNAGHMSCPAGTTDIVTDIQLIEIKKWRHWKDAVGQIFAYKRYFQNRINIIHFFGIRPKQKLYNVIKETLESYGIEMVEEKEENVILKMLISKEHLIELIKLISNERADTDLSWDECVREIKNISNNYLDLDLAHDFSKLCNKSKIKENRGKLKKLLLWLKEDIGEEKFIDLLKCNNTNEKLIINSLKSKNRIHIIKNRKKYEFKRELNDNNSPIIKENDYESICEADTLTMTQVEQFENMSNVTDLQMYSCKKTRLLKYLHVDPKETITPEFIKTYLNKTNQHRRLEKILPLLEIEYDRLDQALNTILEKDIRYIESTTSVEPDLFDTKNIRDRESYFKIKHGCILIELLGFNTAFDNRIHEYKIHPGADQIVNNKKVGKYPDTNTYAQLIQNAYDYIIKERLWLIYKKLPAKFKTDASRQLRYINELLNESFGIKVASGNANKVKGQIYKQKKYYLQGFNIWTVVKTTSRYIIVPTGFRHDPELDKVLFTIDDQRDEDNLNYLLNATKPPTKPSEDPIILKESKNEEIMVPEIFILSDGTEIMTA